MTVTGTSVSFNNTVDGDVVDDKTLTVVANGVTTFGAAVGGIVSLRALATDAIGITAVNGGTINAGGGTGETSISFGDTLTLGANTTLTGAAVALAGVIGAGKDLTVNSSAGGSGTTTLNGAINVGSLTTDAPERQS